MINKNLDTEKNWQNTHVNEGELGNPYWNHWSLYHWETIFYKIISIYDFNDKTIFVGGCGSGIFEEWLYKNHIKYKKITALDISEKMIYLAKKRCKLLKKIKYICGDIENTNLNNNEFDACVIIDALHHVPNYFNTIKEMKRIGNVLILSEPNALNPIRRINEIKYLNEGVTEKSFYIWKLNIAMMKAGYKNIHVFHQHYIPSFTPKYIMNVAKKIEPVLARFLSVISGSLLMIAE